MKKLIYIFIPILAILLMSHNTYALNFGASATYYINAIGFRDTNGYYTCSTSTVGYGAFCSNSQLGSTAGIIYEASIIPNNPIPANSLISFDITIGNTGGALTYYGFAPARNRMYVVQEHFSYDNLSQTVTSHVVLYTHEEVSEFGIATRIASVYGSASVTMSPLTVSVLLGNENPSAEDIADAVNAPEEQASNDIENQDTSDIDTGDDSSATNLIGNINTLFTQIGNIQASDSCSVPADFGNLDLGNINFCTGKDKLPFVVTFGAYAFELIFVVGTAIILVKQVLGLFDWARS